ncbi:unnamed protein product [Rangifer tarandus platyrhynchus]|uniref:Uncharacterized protein n=2 Tax=Rangifer tarandus platyrhynchus TaxID=3082113 RepID=A0AC60A3M0_RANTA|nr:unnamed protein product [Rangifer tarandus platyrhynchus]
MLQRILKAPKILAVSDYLYKHFKRARASQAALVVKNPPANGVVRDTGSIPGSGRSPEGGQGKPLLCSCLENPWTEEPGGIQSMGSERVRHDQSDLAHAQSYITIFTECVERVRTFLLFNF